MEETGEQIGRLKESEGRKRRERVLKELREGKYSSMREAYLLNDISKHTLYAWMRKANMKPFARSGGRRGPSEEGGPEGEAVAEEKADAGHGPVHDGFGKEVRFKNDRERIGYLELQVEYYRSLLDVCGIEGKTLANAKKKALARLLSSEGERKGGR